MDNVQIINLQANKEGKILIRNPSDVVHVELLSGSAEIFGVEMIINKIYPFSSSFTVSTLNGCALKLKGKIPWTYTVNYNHTIIDLHLSLEEKRKLAEKSGVKGPTVLIAGPTDVGKSTLCRTLLNYAVRSGRIPVYIDLDVGQSSISIPGTISILPVDSPADIVNGYNDSKSSVYFFGYKNPGLNMLLYFLLINKVGETLHNRLKFSKNALTSGVIVDTCGWVTGNGYRSIVLAAESFDINLLIVVEDENLHKNLKKDLPNKDIRFIPKLNGAVERSRSARIERRSTLIHEYFYGSDNSIKPHTFNIKFSDIEMFRVSSYKSKVKMNMIKDAQNYISLMPISITKDLLYHLLAISYADSGADENIMLTSVLGFICVTEIDMDNQTITVLSPQPGPLPKNILLVGDIQYQHSNKSSV